MYAYKEKQSHDNIRYVKFKDRPLFKTRNPKMR